MGWVYNFETESGYYLADGYATHNCRCVWLPTINEDAPRGRTPAVPTTGPRLVPEERFDPVEATPDEFVAALRERAEQGAARKAAISDEFDELNAEYAQLYQRYEEGAFTEEAMAAKRAALQEKRIEVRARYDAVLEEAQPDVRDLLVHRGAARKEVTTTRTRTIQSAIGDEIDKAEEWLNDVVPARWKAAIDDVKIGTDRGGRSYHENGQIKMGKRKSAKTVVHEMGHAFGYYDRYRAPTSQNLLVQERAWRDARQAASGKGVQRLRDLTGIRYGLDEVADPDEFFSPYVGKIYEWGSTEVLSMGLEEMYRNPIEFFEKDPEHFAFILRFLQGKDPYPEGAP